jgi:hypothetical protein
MSGFIRNLVLLMLSAPLVIVLCTGCGPADHLPPTAKKLSEQPLTYQIVDAKGCPSLHPHLLRVWVFDAIPDPNIPPYIKVHQWHRLNMKVYWEVIARKPIPAEGLQITVGEVPEGFEQTVPTGRPFVPQSGRRYSFGFETDWPCYQTYGADSTWLDFARREHAKQR